MEAFDESQEKEKQERIANYVTELVALFLATGHEERKIFARAILVDGLNLFALQQTVREQLNLAYEKDRAVIVRAVQKAGNPMP